MTDQFAADVDDRDWKYWTRPTFVEIDGTPTAYRRGGSGPTVLYLHGTGISRSWLPFHAALAERVDLVAPEHPGFGDTERPAHMDTWNDWVLHYDAFLDALELTDVHLVGHGLGAQLAANLAATYPRRFATVTLLNPTGLRLLDDEFRDPYRLLPEEDDAARFNGRAAEVADQLVQQGSPEDDVQQYVETTTTALLSWNPRYDLKLDTRLARITAPFLALGVDHDDFFGDLQAPRYAELVPSGQYARIPGRDGAPSSHMVLLDQPADTANAIADHVAAHS